MLGYIYKTTNTETGEFYYCQRLYEMDERSNDGIYYGSSDIVRSWPSSVKTKEIICECNSYNELDRREAEYIDKYWKDPLCVNSPYSSWFGGIYTVGTCKKCGRETVIYNNSGLCMSCIVGKANKEYCDICGKYTYRYKDGRCRSCVSKEAHTMEFCEYCQEDTSHFGNMCKHHNIKLVKNEDGTISLCKKRGKSVHVIIKDVEKVLQAPLYDNGKSIVFNVISLNMKISSMNSMDNLRGIIINRDVDNWVKITYAINGRKDQHQTLTVTTDHPLVVKDGTVKEAKDLHIGDELVRTNVRRVGSGMQYKFAKIVDISPVDKMSRSYDVTTESGYFDINNDIYSHNCRSFLTPDRSGNGFGNVARAKNYEHNKPKYYGRFNQGVVTINLPDVALSSHKNFDKFWSIFDERLELCHKALRCRHERLKGTLSDAAPILWQHGALARLEKGETIDKLLYGGYSTISLGYAGLYECVKYMTGKSHTDKEASPFALSVMQYMNDKCSKWKAEEDIDYSLYGTPIESTTYKFAKCLQDRFGVVPGVTDKGYITNSYHVHVSEKVDAFTKLKFESKFQALSPGGAISYVEVPNMQDNLQAVIRVMQFIYENIMYAELNTKSDYCQTCGYDGEIRIVEDDGKLVWECPCCGERDTSKLNVARRTCGYIGTQFWNQGRTEEIRDRVLHL